MKKTSVEINGKTIVIETGLVAKQADGSTLIKCGDTVLLSTAVADVKEREGVDFFPLTVDYQEKSYSAGKIPGGFFKREGRPSEKEVLISRIVDRSIRPLFPKGFHSETQCITSVLSFGTENITDVLGVIGVSAALCISNVPFNGPVSAVRVGMVDSEIVINPDLASVDSLTMDLIVSGTDDAVIMVEGRADEVSEDTILDVINKAHAEIKKINAAQRSLMNEAGSQKREIKEKTPDTDFQSLVESTAIEKIKSCIAIPDKLKRQTALQGALDETIAAVNPADRDRSGEIADVFYALEKKTVRDMIIKTGIRADGRKTDEIRPISISVGMLPRVHGSALFTRGETQVLAVVTLGTREDEQKIDALEGEYYKRFMLHYNFPPFSVGEARFLKSPGRREIGHGNLAERAILSMLPQKDDFPYTIRIVSDVLESNGSSSMATVCSSSLALMEAGVPVKAHVAGIAMGLVKEGDQTKILTDILGLEDHLGDMDFKVTGTEKGITAFQMDVKITDLDMSVMHEALNQAKEGRLFIIGKMKDAIASPREVLSPHAPRIYTMQIKQDKIRDVIGTGGKVIKGIIEETGVKININDDGLISIASSDEESAQKAINIVKGIVEEPEVGKIYTGKVVRIAEFGAFIQILPGTDGLLHISQISDKRVNKVTDELNEGDEVTVKVIEIDKMGRVRLSRKELLKERNP